MGRVRGLAKRIVRALHPCILVSTKERSWPVDTDKASDLAERLWNTDAGRELATQIHHAVALRSFVNPESSDKLVLLETISEWIAEAGEETVGEQVLNLRTALRADLGVHD